MSRAQGLKPELIARAYAALKRRSSTTRVPMKVQRGVPLKVRLGR